MSKRWLGIKPGPLEEMPQSGLRSDSENRRKAYSHIRQTIDCLEASQKATTHALRHARRVARRIEGEMTQD